MVHKDFELAARYFHQSAQQANEDGARNIGIYYALGRGVEKNLVQGYFWLNIAAMGTFSQMMNAVRSGAELEKTKDPRKLGDMLSEIMSPAQISEAQKLIRDWRPSFQDGPPAAVSLKAAVTNAADMQTPNSPIRIASTGTAFWVSKAGHGITNHHVINGCKEVRIQGRAAPISVVTTDKVNDLALIHLQGGIPDVADLASNPDKLKQGEDILVFGFPLNSVLSSGGNLTPGIVSAVTGIDNNTNQIQITAPIQPGSSGSPVMNKKAEVVAVVSMKLSDMKMAKATGSVGQNVNFAISGQTLRSFLDANKVEYKSGGVFSRAKDSVDIAVDARKWTTVVECWK